jgi:hypothetical protein
MTRRAAGFWSSTPGGRVPSPGRCCRVRLLQEFLERRHPPSNRFCVAGARSPLTWSSGPVRTSAGSRCPGWIVGVAKAGGISACSVQSNREGSRGARTGAASPRTSRGRHGPRGGNDRFRVPHTPAAATRGGRRASRSHAGRRSPSPQRMLPAGAAAASGASRSVRRPGTAAWWAPSLRPRPRTSLRGELMSRWHGGHQH